MKKEGIDKISSRKENQNPAQDRNEWTLYLYRIDKARREAADSPNAI